MQIVVFGAGGPTGRQVVEQGLAAGHRIVAVTRRPEQVALRDGLTVAVADVTDAAAVDAAVEGGDAVVSTVGVRPSRAPITTYSAGATTIIAAMHRHAVQRLVVVSSSALDPQWRPSGEFFFNTVLDPLVNRKVARTAHDDMRRMEELVMASDLAWTIVRPAGLFDASAGTPYEVAEDSADGVFTARADLAAGMLAALSDDRFVRRAMGVVTTATRPTLVGLLWKELFARAG